MLHGKGAFITLTLLQPTNQEVLARKMRCWGEIPELYGGHYGGLQNNKVRPCYFHLDLTAGAARLSTKSPLMALHGPAELITRLEGHNL